MAYHTYEFLRKRRNDPKWRESYISARNKRILSFLILGNVLLWGGVLWRYIEHNYIDVTIYINEFKQSVMTYLK